MYLVSKLGFVFTVWRKKMEGFKRCAFGSYERHLYLCLFPSLALI